MSLRARMTVAAGLAVLLACSALFPVFDSGQWILRTVLAVGVVIGTGAVCRRAAVPGPVQPLLQVVALLAYVVVVFAGATLHHVLLPGSATVTALRALYEDIGTDLALYGTPAPPTTALVLLVVLGVGAVTVVVDLLAVVGRRAALAGLPLLLLFAVPSAVVPDGVGGWPFLFGAAGWLGLLLVEGSERVTGWGAPSGAGGAPPGDPAGLSRVGRRIGGAALGVAVLVPAVLPGLDGQLIGGRGTGDGEGGGGSRNVATYNPITRLRGQLTLPDPVPVLRYTTNDIQPDYLRMTTLGTYDGQGWQQEPLTGSPRRNGVTRGIPVPVGRTPDVPAREVEARIEVEDLEAFWLPAPATPNAVDVDGPWMWDAGSESVFATRSTTSRVDPYVVRSTRVLPDPAILTAATGEVPAAVQPYDQVVEATPVVRALTARVVAGQTTDYGRAAAIQGFFRDPKNRFRYAEDTLTGGSPDALQDFLEQRVGFCEQYSSAMAAMLRLAGVPSRVAVGFTPGKRLDDGSYLVTTDEAHAWPEAWFEGAGWVRFEPTPARGGIRPPSYAQPPAAAGPGAGTPQSPTGPEAATGPGADDETPLERKDRLDAEAQGRNGTPATGPTAAADGLPVRRTLAGAGLLLLVASPALLHAGRRHRRWRTPDSITAWAQLRDDATDAGHDWSDADSPRGAVARLVRRQSLDDLPAAAAGRVATAVERARYARPDAARDERGLAHEVAVVRRALHCGLSFGTRLRVAVLPPSTLRWASAVLGGRTADLLDALDRGVSAVGAAVRTRVRRRSA